MNPNENQNRQTRGFVIFALVSALVGTAVFWSVIKILDGITTENEPKKQLVIKQELVEPPWLFCAERRGSVYLREVPHTNGEAATFTNANGMILVNCRYEWRTNK